MIDTKTFLMLALAVAAISFTLSKSTMPLIVPIRAWLSQRANWIKELTHCPYCTSNWVALVVVVLCRPLIIHSGFPVLDWFLSWQALVGLAMVPIFALLFIVKTAND